MQYMHIYYQQPFLNPQETHPNNQLQLNTPPSNAEIARIEEVKELPRK
jgi:hypothetical protein